MKYIIVFLLIPINLEAAGYGSKKSSYCYDCPPKVVVTNTTSVSTKTRVENNIIYPPQLAPMEFLIPEDIRQPLRRRFQFSNNTPKLQLKQRIQQPLVKYQEESQPFLIQNVVTSGTDIEATIINQGIQESKASSYTTTTKKIIQENKSKPQTQIKQQSPQLPRPFISRRY